MRNEFGDLKMSSTKLRVKELLRERRWTTKVLAEKTGMSESYLTHIKNGTRRWNEDALRKLSEAFNLNPVDLFANKNVANSFCKEISCFESNLETTSGSSKVRLIPVVSEIPSNPSVYNNQQLQLLNGNNGKYSAAINTNDEDAFCLEITTDSMTPRFLKGDQLVISPSLWTRSGDMVAVEFELEGKVNKGVFIVNYMDDFVILESVNHREVPIALIKGKDTFKIIGKVIWRYQALE